jgi:AcrR family transcriptional regulator
MRTRLRRAEQADRNRRLVLTAARRVFLARGYAGATLEAIAEEAGFSKGVVYSQFGSKADLFVALLERRIEERAAQNERIAAELAGGEGVRELLRVAGRDAVAEPGWARLLVEFRALASRDPALNRRYAEAHARTVEQLARVLGRLHERAGLEPAVALRSQAELILALGAGIALERSANPAALAEDDVIAMLPRALGLPDSNDGRPAGRAATVGPHTAGSREEP